MFYIIDNVILDHLVTIWRLALSVVVEGLIIKELTKFPEFSVASQGIVVLAI